MGFATTTTGHRTALQGGETRIIRTEVVGTSLINVIQTTVTEREQYLGLSESVAKGLASPATTGGPGLIKTALGGIKITVVNKWFSVFACRGTIETATASRMGDTNMWQVEYQKQTLTATADGGTVENI